MSPPAGLLGLGNMGRGLAGVLSRAGLLAAAWDVSEAARAALPPEVAASPEAVARCKVILLAVPGSAQIAEFLDRADGPLTDAEGRVLVDLTTSHPTTTRALAERAAAAGAHYLDAGMTGGAAAAAEGRLTLMLGGSEDGLATARPVLNAIAARIFPLGPSGAGHAMKLAHNMICHTVFLATVEGVRAAARAGIPPDRAVEVLNVGNARSFISERRFPDHILTGSFDGRSPVANLAKDLAMAADLFEDLGQPAPYAQLTARLLAEARKDGHAEEDFTRLWEHYDRIATREDG